MKFHTEANHTSSPSGINIFQILLELLIKCRQSRNAPDQLVLLCFKNFRPKDACTRSCHQLNPLALCFNLIFHHYTLHFHPQWNSQNDILNPISPVAPLITISFPEKAFYRPCDPSYKNATASSILTRPESHKCDTTGHGNCFSQLQHVLHDPIWRKRRIPEFQCNQISALCQPSSSKIPQGNRRTYCFNNTTKSKWALPKEQRKSRQNLRHHCYRSHYGWYEGPSRDLATDSNYQPWAGTTFLIHLV